MAAAQVTRALEDTTGTAARSFAAPRSVKPVKVARSRSVAGGGAGGRRKDGGLGTSLGRRYACSDSSSRILRPPPDRTAPGYPMPPRLRGSAGGVAEADAKGQRGATGGGGSYHANEEARPPEQRGGRGGRRRRARPRTDRAGGARLGQTGPD